jgi:hypothetical protein
MKKLSLVIIGSLMLAGIIIGCSEDTSSSTPTVLETWTGTISGDSVSIPSMVVNHLFTCTLRSDETYDVVDSLSIGFTTVAQTGTWSKEQSDYTFTPLQCMGLDGETSSANCTAPFTVTARNDSLTINYGMLGQIVFLKQD